MSVGNKQGGGRRVGSLQQGQVCVCKEDQGSGGEGGRKLYAGTWEKEAELAHFTDPSPSEEVPCCLYYYLGKRVRGEENSMKSHAWLLSHTL